MKELSIMFKNLTERKRNKYIQAYQDAMAVYREEMGKRPQPPKRPQNAFSLFYSSKNDEYKEEFPELTASERMKKAGEDYKLLTDEEKQVFKDQYEAAMVVYNKQHPSPQSQGPEFPKQPFQLCQEKHEDVDTEQKFHALNQKRKLKYIKQSVEELRQYREAAEAHAVKYPNPKLYQDKCKFKSGFYYPLTRYEVSLWLTNVLGAPEEPQKTSREQFAFERNLNPNEAQLLWDQMSPTAQGLFKKSFTESKKNYNDEYKGWWVNLDPWIMKELTAMNKAPKEFSNPQMSKSVSGFTNSTVAGTQ